MCKTIPPEIFNAIKSYSPSKALADLIDASWAELYGRDPVEPLPIRLMRGLSEREAVVHQAVWETCAATNCKIQELQAQRAPRRANCGQSAPTHIRKISEAGVHDAVIRFKCGRSDCLFCWRQRKIRTLKRALKRLAFLDERTPRRDNLFTAAIPWTAWPALNRKLRRAHGKQVGRLHLRTTDGNAIVIAEVDFEGAKEVPVSEAMQRILGDIEIMHQKRSAFRLLGRWSDNKSSGWKVLGRFESAFDLQIVQDELKKLGKKSSWGWKNQPEVEQGLRWRCASEAEADELFARLISSCHFLDIGMEQPYRRKSDKRRGKAVFGSGGQPENETGPFDEGIF